MTYENHPSLTPEQQEKFANAEANAWLANEAFDESQRTATIHAQVRNHSARASTKNLFREAQQDLDTYQQMAAVLMPGRAAFETADEVQPFASEAVWNAMRPEQRAWATDIRTAVVAGRLSEFGVTEDSLRVIAAEVDGKIQFALVHTGSGVDIGDPKKDYDLARSHTAVMSAKNDALFQVEVRGTMFDTRSGMTELVYDAKVADARERGVTLPDSQELSKETGDVWTWTMLTGEKLTAGGDVPLRDVSAGQVRRYASHPEDGPRDLRVCPAVVIPN